MAIRMQPALPGRLLPGGPAAFSPQQWAVGGLLAALLLAAAPAGAATTQSQGAQPQSTASKPASSSQPKARKKKASAHSTRRQLAPEPARIREIQEALARQGFYQGEPTGKWDESTVTAMKSFQQSNNLAPTGKIEALSLQKLGLGSATAGMAPPESKTPPEPRAPAGASPPSGSPSHP